MMLPYSVNRKRFKRHGTARPLQKKYRRSFRIDDSMRVDLLKLYEDNFNGQGNRSDIIQQHAISESLVHEFSRWIT